MESGRKERIPLVSTRFRMGAENERADAERDGRTCLARPNSQARAWTGKMYFPCSADYRQDRQITIPVDAQSAERDDHEYIHTYRTSRIISSVFPN